MSPTAYEDLRRRRHRHLRISSVVIWVLTALVALTGGAWATWRFIECWETGYVSFCETAFLIPLLFLVGFGLIAGVMVELMRREGLDIDRQGGTADEALRGVRNQVARSPVHLELGMRGF